MADSRLDADVVVVGAGPAGMAAAVAAAEHGQDVLLLDEGARPGGQVWRHRDRATLPRAARSLLQRLDASAVRVVHGASVAAVTNPLRLLVEIDGRPATAAARHAVVLCTGARERFLPFPGWTLRGVVGVGGAQALLKQGLDVRGRRVIVAGSGPLLFPVSAALAGASARVALVAEQASSASVLRFAAGLWRTPARLLDAARYRASFAASRYRSGVWVTEALGDERVEAARLSNGQVIRCDLLCVGYGLVPATELARLAGCQLANGAVAVDDEHRTTVPGIFCAGEPTGVAGADAAVTQGMIAGTAAAGGRVPATLLRRRRMQLDFADRLSAAFALRDELRQLPRPDTIVCRCEDVTLAGLAACTSMREARLHTRAGMGPCQGRVCGTALELLRGWPADGVRWPAVTVRVATLALTHETAALPGSPPPGH